MIFAKMPALRLSRLAWLLVFGVLAIPGQAVVSEPPVAKDGLFLTVRSPITDQVKQQIKKKIDDAFRHKRKLDTVVFDFNPNGLPNSSSNFGSCYDLAKFIRELRTGYGENPKVNTMAFVAGEVSQHTVLPVLACGQIVMSDALDENTHAIRARIGDIRRGQELGLEESERSYYRKLAPEKLFGDLVERMINKDLPLRKVKTASGVFYLSPTTIANWKAKGEALAEEPDLPAGLEPGNAMFDAGLAQRIGLCQAIYNSRAELASALKLLRRSLAEDLDRTAVPWRIELRAGMDKASMDSLERRIKKAINRGANLLILQLEVAGGETKNAASMAKWIRNLTDDNQQPIKTIAYIPPGTSIGAATFLALGCSEIVMGDGAVLADFTYLHDANEDELRQRREMLMPLVKEQGYPALLFEATLDPNLVLYRCMNKEGESRILSAAELEQDQKSKEPRWSNLGQIAHPKGTFLKIDADLAREWGVALPGKFGSVEDLYNVYGLERSRVHSARDDWLDHVAEFFREPVVNFVLVMLGIIGLILELKMPGTTIPGVMAAICFVLFFWSYSFVGEFTLLAVLLFVLGVILIGVEIFVIPGFGFTGIAGLLLVISGLALVTLERWPTTSEDWVNLGTTLATFCLSLGAAVAGAILVAWFLPSIPYANRLVLQPPTEADEQGTNTAPLSLLGAIGLAATPLRPAGKAQFGDDFLDVIAEGDFVNPGQRVQVIEIEGNRIVVKEI